MADVIRIEGLVVDQKEKKPLSGVKITASRPGRMVQVETDDKGQFLLLLPPEKWKINAALAGYREGDPYIYNFQKDNNEIKFELNEGYSLSGEVIDEHDGSPKAGVVVVAVHKKGDATETQKKISDLEGKFTFTGLSVGEWKVDADPSVKGVDAKTVKVGAQSPYVKLISQRPMKTADRNTGIILFFVLLVLLGGLIWSYLVLHAKFPAAAEPELSAYTLQVEKVGVAADEASKDEKDCQTNKSAPTVADDTAGNTADEASTAAMELLRKSVNSLKENWDLVSSDIYSLSAGQKKQIDLLLSGAVTAASADKSAEVKLAVESLLPVLKNFHKLYLWSSPPWTYLEVLYWSLAGIIIYVFITSGLYLRWKRFIGSGVWMHISHILTVPLIALVVVFILSMLKLSIQLENTEIAINLDDPRLLVAISFVISVSPWPIINFVQDAGERILDLAKEKLGKGSGEDTSTAKPEGKK